FGRRRSVRAPGAAAGMRGFLPSNSPRRPPMTTGRTTTGRANQLRLPWPVLGAAARWFAAAVERSRQRRALQHLDDRLLRDIGLTRRDVQAEIERPSWRR